MGLSRAQLGSSDSRSDLLYVGRVCYPPDFASRCRAGLLPAKPHHRPASARHRQQPSTSAPTQPRARCPWATSPIPAPAPSLRSDKHQHASREPPSDRRRQLTSTHPRCKLHLGVALLLQSHRGVGQADHHPGAPTLSATQHPESCVAGTPLRWHGSASKHPISAVCATHCP